MSVAELIRLIAFAWLFGFLLSYPRELGYLLKTTVYKIYAGIAPCRFEKFLIDRLKTRTDFFVPYCGLHYVWDLQVEMRRVNEDLAQAIQRGQHIQAGEYKIRRIETAEYAERLFVMAVQGVRGSGRGYGIVDSEIGYCSDDLLMRLDPHWEEIIEESFLGDPSVPSFVKDFCQEKRAQRTDERGYGRKKRDQLHGASSLLLASVAGGSSIVSRGEGSFKTGSRGGASC